MFKFLYYSLAQFLPSDDLIRFANTNKYARTLYLSKDFWQFKLQEHFQPFAAYKPLHLNYLQWFQNIDETTLKKAGTLYILGTNENKQFTEDKWVSYVEINLREVWMVDVTGRLYYKSISDWDNHTQLWQDVKSKKVDLTEIHGLREIVTNKEQTVFSYTKQNCYIKQIRRTILSHDIYVLSKNGNLDRNGITIAISVEYLGDSFRNHFCYKRSDGYWIEFLGDKRSVITTDPNVCHIG